MSLNFPKKQPSIRKVHPFNSPYVSLEKFTPRILNLNGRIVSRALEGLGREGRRVAARRCQLRT